MNDIERNFIDIIFAKKILQWKATIHEFICVDFAVGFLIDHLCDIARALFIQKIQLVVDVIDTGIKKLNKEVANLEAHLERLLSGITAPNRFKDQILISDL